MITYDIDANGTVGIKIRKEVSIKDMESLTFTLESFTVGNPNATINFRLEKGISSGWIKYVEKLCENIPNSHSILMETSFI